MIGYWHGSVLSYVYLSVRLSVCNAMHCGSQGQCTKTCTSVFLAGKFQFVPSDTFAVGCVV